MMHHKKLQVLAQVGMSKSAKLSSGMYLYKLECEQANSDGACGGLLIGEEVDEVMQVLGLDLGGFIKGLAEPPIGGQVGG